MKVFIVNERYKWYIKNVLQILNMIINQEVSFIKQNSLFEHIELCGKNAYKSEKSIKDGTADLFIKRILSSKHYSVLEHGSVYIIIDPSKSDNYANCYDFIEFFFCKSIFKNIL